MTDDAQRLHSLVGEKKIALSATLSFGILDQSPRVSADASAPVFQSSLEIYPQISKRADHADETLRLGFFFSERRIFDFSNVCMTLSRLLCSSVKLVKIPAILCPEFCNIVTALLLSYFSTFCYVDLQSSCVRTSTSRQIYIPIQTDKWTFGRMPIVTRWFDANSFQVVFASRWIPVSEPLFFTHFNIFGDSEEGAIFGIDFARLSSS